MSKYSYISKLECYTCYSISVSPVLTRAAKQNHRSQC